MSRNPEHPYEHLYRMTPAMFDVRDNGDDGDDGRTLFGHFARFNTWTRIKSWEGDFLERIQPGAFAKTLSENSDQVKVMFNHGFDPTIGTKPLGKPDVLREDDIGAYMETPLARTSYNADLIELIRAGAIDGMSFMFTVKRDEWNEDPGTSDDNPDGLTTRTIKEVRLYEAGPVTFPAYEATTVGVRSGEAYSLWLRNRYTDPPAAADDAALLGTSDNGNGNAAHVGTLSEARLRRIAARQHRINEVLKHGPHSQAAAGDR